MDETSMKLLSVDDLLKQMIQLTDDVAAMNKRLDNKQSVKKKLKEIQLIQTVIVAKRSEEPPLK